MVIVIAKIPVVAVLLDQTESCDTVDLKLCLHFGTFIIRLAILYAETVHVNSLFNVGNYGSGFDN